MDMSPTYEGYISARLRLAEFPLVGQGDFIQNVADISNYLQNLRGACGFAVVFRIIPLDIL